MRSLTFKLVLAFLLTSVAGVALASIFIRRSVTSEFDSYVIAQQRAGFIDDVNTYYETSGSLAGIDRWLRDQAPRGLVVTPPGPGDTRRFAVRMRFVLVDPAGVVMVPSGPYTIGNTVDRAEMARGTSVAIGGRVVGTVITPDFADFRNVAEERYLARTDAALGIAGAVVVGGALVLGVLLARLITRPVRELTAAAQKIAGGDLEQRVPVRSRDELGLLAVQFNHMSSDLARAVQQRRQMTADVAHDLRTPLTVISGYLEALRDQVLKPTPERFATMYDETRLLLHLVDDLHTLSLVDAGELPFERRSIAPRQLLERVAETYCHIAEQQGVALRIQADAAVPEVCVDMEQLTRALSNLVSNALRHTPAGGTITLAATTDHRPPSTSLSSDKDTRRSGSLGDINPFAPPAPGLAVLQKSVVGRRSPALSGAEGSVVFRVSDTGVGIAAEHLPNIFARFYRVDPARQQETGGSGLGLAIVKSIVETHGGQIDVESTPGEGTVFTIILPLCDHRSLPSGAEAQEL